MTWPLNARPRQAGGMATGETDSPITPQGGTRVRWRLLVSGIAVCGTLLVGVLVLPAGGPYRTFYAATTGVDTRSCDQAQSQGAPKRTIMSAAACMAPGDTLYVRGGTYPEYLNDWGGAIPSGSSWSAPVTIAAYPGEQVIIQPSAPYAALFCWSSYVVLDGLIFDGAGIRYDVLEITFADERHYGHHIRVRNAQVRNGPRTGIGIHQDATGKLSAGYNELINVSVYSNGRGVNDDMAHGIYIDSSDNLIERCAIYNNAGWGVQIYSGYQNGRTNRNVIRHSTIYRNATHGLRGRGITLSTGDANIAHSNVIHNNAGGIDINFLATNTQVNSNLIFDNNGGSQPESRYGIYNGDDQDKGRRGSVVALINDNTVYNNSAGDFVDKRTDAVVGRNFFMDVRPKPAP